MAIRDRDGISVDECPLCGAVWLDGGEVEAILRPYAVNFQAHGEEGVGQGSDGGAFVHGVGFFVDAVEILEPLVYVGRAILYVIGSLAHLG
ncbi:MAG TPA: zf-TFIIB domain-containing protein [Thermoanaerobaculia bacterium]|jgi:hypothetical protein|nr:zf-TFIIB domain-containing protein [Thermoanaerobaculia bacterium]